MLLVTLFTTITVPLFASFLFTFFEFLADQRVEKWLLMESPVPILTIFVLYLVMVKQGPRWMEQYKPLQLQGWLVLYNLALVALSVYMFEEVSSGSSCLNKIQILSNTIVP